MGKPIYLEVEKTIHQPLEVVWSTVAGGFGKVSEYNPAIKFSRLESDSSSGIGMVRHCDFQKSGYIKERIIAWEEGKSFRLQFTESSVPIAILESQFDFEEHDGKTIITQKFWYRMKAPMGWMSGLMKSKMQSTLEIGLQGLENYLKQQ